MPFGYVSCFADSSPAGLSRRPGQVVEAVNGDGVHRVATMFRQETFPSRQTPEVQLRK
jgi:hypothetical protein